MSLWKLQKSSWKKKIVDIPGSLWIWIQKLWDEEINLTGEY
jgi:hypothetical protein